PVIGAPDAPVVLVEYACFRCPFCARITPKLVKEVTVGQLAGKVKLYFKVFPLKGHPGSVESGLAAVAAHEQGRFWEFLNLAFTGFDGFSVEALPAMAVEAGLEPTAYQNAVSSESSRALLVHGKREGMANGVDATPSFFISGRRYQGELKLHQFVDVLEEEHERLTGHERTKQ
ncbi:MAG: thioredoxin domain-containing protein, partial [Proteobacteria bacterium]|nr:thioredoxin domain-containing protein [Pseudomonadota bacterium]